MPVGRPPSDEDRALGGCPTELYLPSDFAGVVVSIALRRTMSVAEGWPRNHLKFRRGAGRI
jgi:hypothetical protein